MIICSPDDRLNSQLLFFHLIHSVNWTQGSGRKQAYICALIITLLYLSCFSTASCTLHNHHSVVLDSFNQCWLVLKYWQLTSLLQHVFVHIHILKLFSVLIQVILTCWDRFLDHTNKYYFVKPIQTPEWTSQAKYPPLPSSLEKNGHLKVSR